jgi:uncharacterized protein (TIGR02246 family)
MGERHNPANNEAAIRPVVEDWAGAVRRKDIAGILRNHSSDILMFDVPPPLQSKGIEAYEKTWDLFFDASPNPPVFDIHEMTVTPGDDVAFVVATMGCVVKEANGTSFDMDFRLTIGLRKIGDRWIICHEHHSIPATD